MPANPVNVPQAGQEYEYDGRRFRLDRRHEADASIWVAIAIEGGAQRFIGQAWLEEHQPVGGSAVTQAAPQAEPQAETSAPTTTRRSRRRTTTERRSDELEDISDDELPEQPAAPSNPICPACHTPYTGVLGVQHACARIQAIRCRACQTATPEHLERPPRPPYICATCVAANAWLCFKCGTIQRRRSRYEGVCDACNPMPSNSVWDQLDGHAMGNDVTIETRSHRPFACEVECFRMTAEGVIAHTPNIGGGWQIAGDGSIQPDSGAEPGSAREFRSPPFKGDAGLRLMRDGVKRLRDMGYRANRSCGLHVHVDMVSSSEQDRDALWNFGKWVQDDMFKLVARSRSQSQYCKRLGNDRGDRYLWLNIDSAFDRHRTVEVRLHHGTTQPDRVYQWAKLCLRLVETGMKLGHMSARPRGGLFDLLQLSAFERGYWLDVARTLHGHQTTVG